MKTMEKQFKNAKEAISKIPPPIFKVEPKPRSRLEVLPPPVDKKPV